MSMKPILERFPKERPELPPGLAAIYLTHYRQNRDGLTPATSISKRMEAWMHKQVARDLSHANEARSTLEIGAGTLNHLPYEPAAGAYDIVEPLPDLYQGSVLLDRVRHIFDDIHQVPNETRYDRIVSIATFEHLLDLPRVVAKCGRLLAPGGQLRVAIPSEGGPLWWLGWKLTTGVEFRLRYGLDYSQLMKHEHVNTADEVELVLAHFFQQLQSKVLGINKTISFYRFYACAAPVRRSCRELLDRAPRG